MIYLQKKNVRKWDFFIFGVFPMVCMETVAYVYFVLLVHTCYNPLYFLPIFILSKSLCLYLT